jgi:hypothetical protein
MPKPKNMAALKAQKKSAQGCPAIAGLSWVIIQINFNPNGVSSFPSGNGFNPFRVAKFVVAHPQSSRCAPTLG